MPIVTQQYKRIKTKHTIDGIEILLDSIIITGDLYCPFCNEIMDGYDTVMRTSKSYDNDDTNYFIPRYICPNDMCSCHIMRVLPDFIEPRKHYNAEIIEDAVSGRVYPGDDCFDDYPCDSTFRNWNKENELNKQHIVGSLNAVLSVAHNSQLNEHVKKILHEMREKKRNWRLNLNCLLSKLCISYLPLSLLLNYPPTFIMSLDNPFVESSRKEDRSNE